MGGGGTTFVCDARGSGYLAARGMLLTCWEADPLFFGGPQVYLRAGGKTLSINRCAEVLFRRGRAVYTLEMENLRAELTCFVSPLDGAAIQACAACARRMARQCRPGRGELP